MSKKHKKQDQSQHVHQKEKISRSLQIKELPWTEKQKEIIKIAQDKNTSIIILDGLPGTSKSLTSVYNALRLIDQKRVSGLIYIRSTIQSFDGQTGYLTGDLDEKMQYFNIPLTDKLEELLNKNDIKTLFDEGRIEAFPTSMLRGYNFNAKAILVDEGQNLSFDSLFTAATRIGKFSKLFILGDSEFQNDLGHKSGFKEFCSIFNNEEGRKNGIFYFKLGVEDIVRSDICQFIVQQVYNYRVKNQKLV